MQTVRMAGATQRRSRGSFIVTPSSTSSDDGTLVDASLIDTSVNGADLAHRSEFPLRGKLIRDICWGHAVYLSIFRASTKRHIHS